MPIPVENVHLFGHCTERTAAPQAAKLWLEVLRTAGLRVQNEDLGCCGMCGVYGHELAHVQESLGIFEQSWGPRLDSIFDGSRLAMTGHSCRHQVHRAGHRRGEHPCEILWSRLQSATAALPATAMATAMATATATTTTATATAAPAIQ